VPCLKMEKSGQAEAVVAGRVIRPLGIAEIERTVGERDGLNRSPNRPGQIGAGFHHDCKIGCAGDVEPKLIALHAKAGIACLDQRVPQDRRETGIGGEGTPAGGSRQIIDRHWVTVERIAAELIVNSGGSVAPAIDVGQAAAKYECPFPDGGDAVGKRDTGQAGAVPERIIPDVGDAVRNRDIR